ncbi:MBL fold metallo-hydrolase [Isoptericola sp. b441]|uniref:MBL fold metallo-hydrolase n=1 Tax=Actinotalea lenta TaxID=3064654 RepID=A0ABT9DBW1_9CELL|nr:MBL fold metallo-hydrolase [Isoptericola sp. b441]MDO8108378.1 MBL fold metallo-hydrolase [Isoptericola sp. b441]
MPAHTGTQLLLLGTAGGAATYPVRGAGASARSGIASAIVVGGRVHLVDAGQGVARQLTFADVAGAGPAHALRPLRAVYLTHLHSDHTMDLVNLLHCGYVQGWPDAPVDVFGPGPRDGVPGAPTDRRRAGAHLGTTRFLERLIDAFAADFDDRVSASRRPEPSTLVTAHDVLPPAGSADVSAGIPPVDPWFVAEYPDLRVTATLVDHGEMLPSLAYRFDTEAGSVVFSGDTSPSPNLVRLAQGADILVHEVIAARYATWQYGPEPLTERQRLAAATVMAKHTPSDQVGAIAEAAGVRTLVLTHLVPASVPAALWREAVRGFSGEVVVGEDLLTIPVGR